MHDLNSKQEEDILENLVATGGTSPYFQNCVVIQVVKSNYKDFQFHSVLNHFVDLVQTYYAAQEKSLSLCTKNYK